MFSAAIKLGHSQIWNILIAFVTDTYRCTCVDWCKVSTAGGLQNWSSSWVCNWKRVWTKRKTHEQSSLEKVPHWQVPHWHVFWHIIEWIPRAVTRSLSRRVQNYICCSGEKRLFIGKLFKIWRRCDSCAHRFTRSCQVWWWKSVNGKWPKRYFA